MSKNCRRHFFILGCTVCLMALAAMLVCSCQAADEEPAVSLFSKYERAITSKELGLTGKFNPYDAESVKVDSLVTVPGGEQATFPCFWYVPCEQFFVKLPAEQTGALTDWERFRATGPGTWCFRFCPTVEGEYRYNFSVTVGGESWVTLGGSFRAVRGETTPSGFIRLRPNSNYFQFQNGRAFIPVGQNLGWPEESGSRGYETWLKRLHAAGANCGRLWLVHYFSGTALEWSSSNVNAGYKGVGNFSQESAARVDRILQAAADQDMYLILSFFSFGDTNWDWNKNPYSREAGGWLDHPADFFTDGRARKAVKNRLRYAAARYGWCPNIWAWELWNEVETSAGFDDKTVFDWHREMADYLARIDGDRHLITTSYRFTPPTTECYAYGLDAVDFIQAHSYLPQITDVFPRRIGSLGKYRKPVLIAEYGLYVSPNYFDADPAGLHVHDGLWAGLFSGSAGGGMTWWWERYVHPRNLYFHYSGIARFLRETKFEAARPCSILLQPASEAYFAFALQAEDKTFAWIGSQRNVMWEDTAEEPRFISYSCKPEGEKLKVVLTGSRVGKHTVVFFDTFDGVPLQSIEVEGTEGSLAIPVPEFRHDIALVLYAEKPEGLTVPLNKTPTPIHDRFDRLAGAEK